MRLHPVAAAGYREAVAGLEEWVVKDCATLAAEKLMEQYMIGTSSRFCDEPADFDSATLEEIAEVIRQCYEIQPTGSQHGHESSKPMEGHS